MQRNIHPKNHTIDAHCVCGKAYPTMSTKDTITVTFCSGCHPYFTRTQKFVDARGRIDRFNKKFSNFIKS